MELMKINEDVTVGAQPSAQRLKELAQNGFKTIVNFRTDGEDDQPISPADEGEKARQLGLEYLHVPVSMKSTKPETVDQFRQRYNQLPKPVFAHCKSGKRAGAMVMMHIASEQGMTGKDTLEKAEQMGFKCEQPELREFVEQYVDKHRV